MKNIPVTLDKETAAWARVHAAQRNISLSRFVGELLHRHMSESREYEEAMRRYLSRGPFRVLKGSPERYPTREELHERSRIR
jgi:hypothetical protein